MNIKESSLQHKLSYPVFWYCMRCFIQILSLKLDDQFTEVDLCRRRKLCLECNQRMQKEYYGTEGCLECATGVLHVCMPKVIELLKADKDFEALVQAKRGVLLNPTAKGYSEEYIEHEGAKYRVIVHPLKDNSDWGIRWHVDFQKIEETERFWVDPKKELYNTLRVYAKECIYKMKMHLWESMKPHEE